MLNDAMEKFHMDQYWDSKRHAEDIAKDKFAKKIMQDARDLVGATKTVTNDDVRSQIKYLEQDDMEFYQQTVEDAKDARVYAED